MDSSTDNVNTSTACSRGNNHHETPRLCAAGCGFFGTAENHGLCSQCYNGRLKEANAKIEAAILGKAQEEKEIGEVGGALSSLTISESTSSAPPPRSRCSVCRRRVGLLGFGCRCGANFCGSHRYPEAHDCTFDFKEAGKIAILKENPICKADKITRRI